MGFKKCYDTNIFVLPRLSYLEKRAESARTFSLWASSTANWTLQVLKKKRDSQLVDLLFLSEETLPCALTHTAEFRSKTTYHSWRTRRRWAADRRVRREPRPRGLRRSRGRIGRHSAKSARRLLVAGAPPARSRRCACRCCGARAVWGATAGVASAFCWVSSARDLFSWLRSGALLGRILKRKKYRT